MSDSSELLVDLSETVVVLGQFPVLTDFSLKLQSGDITWLEGPNGAGKTTALRLCAGLVRPTSGRARVLGFDLFDERVRFRPLVGYLGHHNALYGDLTARENIAFSVRSHHGSADSIDDVCAHLGLSTRVLDTRADRLSAGQKRRTSLASLLVRRPKLWLLDEPHAGLDSETRDVLDDVVRDVVKSGAGVLLASHDSHRASALATRRVHLDAGASSEASHKDVQHVG